MPREKKKKSSLPIILLFLIGAMVLLYPSISDAWNGYVNSQRITSYSQEISTLNSEEKEKIMENAREYNSLHTCNIIRDTFDGEEYILSHPYDTLLNPNNDEIMGYLEIPVIHVELAVYHGTSTTSLEQGIGHVEGTSLPVGGKGTHSVLAGHSGLPSARLFTDLDRVKIGDLFYMHVLDEVLAYEVDQVEVVLPDATEGLAIDPEQDYMTLITCTPYGVNTHRLLVRGHRVEYVAEAVKEKTLLDQVKALDPKLLAAGGILVLMVIVGIAKFVIQKTTI